MSKRGRLFIELQTTISALALAWVAKNPNTSTVILGASRPEQILENLKALEVIPKLTPAIMEKIEKILGSAPESLVRCFILGCAREGLLITMKYAFSLHMGAQCWIGLVEFKELYESRCCERACKYDTYLPTIECNTSVLSNMTRRESSKYHHTQVPDSG